MKRRTVLQTGVAALVLPWIAGLARADDVKPAHKIVAKVGRNHGHVFPVQLADVHAEVDKTYDIAGTAGHAHSITLSADDFQRVRAGEIVRVVSSREGGHVHRLLVRCVPAIDPPEAINVCDIEIGGKDDHEFVINAPDMAAKADRTYDVQGIAGHTHSVVIAAADFQKLGHGAQLSLTTSPGDGHTHLVYVRYPAKKG